MVGIGSATLSFVFLLLITPRSGQPGRGGGVTNM